MELLLVRSGVLGHNKRKYVFLTPAIATLVCQATHALAKPGALSREYPTAVPKSRKEVFDFNLGDHPALDHDLRAIAGRVFLSPSIVGMLNRPGRLAVDFQTLID
jgi:hypothetical protein